MRREVSTVTFFSQRERSASKLYAASTVGAWSEHGWCVERARLVREASTVVVVLKMFYNIAQSYTGGITHGLQRELQLLGERRLFR